MAVVVTSKRKKKNRGGKSAAMKFLPWVAIVFVLFVAGMFFMSTREAEPVVASQGVAEVGDEKTVAEDGNPPKAAKPPKADGDRRMPPRQDGAPPMDSELRASNSELSSEPPPPPREKEKKRLVVRPLQTPKVFDNDVENWLEAMSKEGFASLQTPRVNMSDEEIMAILKTDIVIYEDDDEETVAAKERTAQIKQEAIKYIEEGGSFNQFLRAYADVVREEQETRKDVEDEMHRILVDEGEEAAQAYLAEANPKLAEMGIKEVVINEFTLFFADQERKRKLEEAQQKQEEENNY